MTTPPVLFVEALEYPLRALLATAPLLAEDWTAPCFFLAAVVREDAPTEGTAIPFVSFSFYAISWLVSTLC